MAIIKIKNPAIDLDAAEIPNLPASKITTGTIDNARISLDANEIPNLDTAKITTGTFADARMPSTVLNSNVDLTNLSATNLTSGTVPIARLGTSGTKDATTFLRGDNTFAEAGGGIENITTFLMTTDFTMNNGIHHISTNWSTYGASLGSSVTESSGIFSFPQTGFYMVITNFALYRVQGDSAYVGIRLDTTNNNSTYTNKTRNYTAVNDSADFHSNMHQEYIFDVTDIANDKVKVNYESETASNIRLIGNSTIEQTTVKFIRLGDT